MGSKLALPKDRNGIIVQVLKLNISQIFTFRTTKDCANKFGMLFNLRDLYQDVAIPAFRLRLPLPRGSYF